MEKRRELGMVQQVRGRCRGTAGFSLIEMVIVIAVIAVIVGIAIPVISGVQKQSQITRAQGDMRAIRDAYQKFIADTGLLPDIDPAGATGTQHEAMDPLAVVPNIQRLTQQNALFVHAWLPGTTDNLANWQGPYLNVKGNDFQQFKDPWGQPYYIAYTDGNSGLAGNTGGKGGIALISSGPNGGIDCVLTTGPTDDTVGAIMSASANMNTLFGAIPEPVLKDDIIVIVTKKLK
ncbi:MAG: prepilin-type N-terminal cleavage/methylation domain-containing protein [Planctomycetes bacterium]|nr:prepilin-type N-terminal cleavage/methylation domain-containing protein [Planctomycetota bacterium]